MPAGGMPVFSSLRSHCHRGIVGTLLHLQVNSDDFIETGFNNGEIVSSNVIE